MLELKQKSIMRAIEGYKNNPKWGNPQRYDLVIEKVKTGPRDRDVKYSVIPEPPSQLDEGIAELAKSIPVRLEALYEGEDPFAVTDREEAPVKSKNGHRDMPFSRKTRAFS